jgi:hypothetical protein
MSRICELCKMTVKENEPDPCLGYLPGVDSACCGHGGGHTDGLDGYIRFENGMIVYFPNVTATSPLCDIVDDGIELIRPFKYHEQYGERP